MPVVCDDLLTCDQIRQKLCDLYAASEKMAQPGVVRVRDSDGSEIQYSLGSTTAINDQIRRLEVIYQTLCSGCSRSTRPFGFVFP